MKESLALPLGERLPDRSYRGSRQVVRQHLTALAAPQWLDGEQATCARWHEIFTARRDLLRTRR